MGTLVKNLDYETRGKKFLTTASVLAKQEKVHTDASYLAAV